MYVFGIMGTTWMFFILWGIWYFDVNIRFFFGDILWELFIINVSKGFLLYVLCFVYFISIEI